MPVRMLPTTASDTRKVIKQSSNTVAVAGYQELGLAGKAGGDGTGLAHGATYNFKITVDNGVQQSKSITTSTTETFTAVMALLNAAMTGVLAGVTWALDTGDLRCTSATQGTNSAVALAAGATDDLFAGITGCALETAVAGLGPAEDPYNMSKIATTEASTYYPISGALNTVVHVWGDTNVTGNVTVDVAPSAAGPWSVVATVSNPTTAGAATPIPAGTLAAAHVRVSAGSFTGGPVRATLASNYPNGNRLW